MKKVVIAGSACTALALVPAVLLLLLVTVLAVPAAVEACSNVPNPRLGPIPSALRARTSDGVEVTLDRQQLEHAATVVAVASRTPGAGPRAARVALMAALTESRLRMLANSRVPGSAERPNDGIGSDHDSLGLFQMRPSTGWGTVTRLMDATYQARAFLGGPTGPNRGSPAGLLDLRDWTALTDARAAQAVEVSAYPDRYAAWAPIADRIIAALTVRSTTDEDDPEERSLVVFPLPSRRWTLTSRFGPRVDPVTGSPGFHHGTDFAAPTGTLIRSATDGRVLSAGDDRRHRHHHGAQYGRRQADRDRVPAHARRRHRRAPGASRQSRSTHRGGGLDRSLHRSAPALPGPTRRHDGPCCRLALVAPCPPRHQRYRRSRRAVLRLSVVRATTAGRLEGSVHLTGEAAESPDPS